ncbi:MAG: hypothetical protein ACRD6W_07285 [Nitrososphaerales archaeon]
MGRKRAEHRNLYLPRELQGTGEARALWKKELELYETLGCVDTVWIESERIGRYANIRSGVEFRDSTERSKVVGAVETVSTGLGIAVDVSTLRHPWDVAEMPERTSRDDVEGAGFVFDPDVRFNDKTCIPLGKAALLTSACPNWVGRIDLDPPSETYRRLREYIDG